MAQPKTAPAAAVTDKSKNQKFVEQGAKKVTELRKKIAKLGDLNRFEPTAEQVDKVIKVLHADLENAGNRLKSRVKQDDATFQF